LHISDGDSILAQTFNSISEVTRKDYATIDLSPPVTTLSTNIDFYGENVASLNFIYTLSATDSISGIDQIKYSLNNGSSISYTTPFTIDVEAQILKPIVMEGRRSRHPNNEQIIATRKKRFVIETDIKPDNYVDIINKTSPIYHLDTRYVWTRIKHQESS